MSVDTLAAGCLYDCSTELDVRLPPDTARMLLNRTRARANHDRLKALVDSVVAGGRAAAAALLEDNPDLTVLDDHQWVNVACMTLEDSYGLCLFDEQGAGKTVTTIFAYDTLVARDQADFALIVAPKSMIAEWPNDFSRFAPDRYDVRIVAGTKRQKRHTLSQGADVFVTNYETAVALETELRNVLTRYGDRAVLVIDESFLAKNLDALRTAALRRLREWCGRAYVLCGTPAPNAPQDLVQQFNTVDFGLTFLGVEVPDDSDEARTVIQRAINDRGLFVRHCKREVLPDLPQKTFNQVLLPLQPVQSDLYQGALLGLIHDIRATDDATFQRQLMSFLARRSALLQICSNPAGLVPGYSETPAKLLALDSLLSRFIDSEGEKVIVWSFFTAAIDAIMARYMRYGPARYDGTVGDVTVRRERIQRFQSDGETMLFVANPAAAGAGLTLHRARIAIYESMSNQAAHYLQSLDRIHRRGQTRDVEYFVLVCDGTIEVEEYGRLLEKERAAQQLLGDEPTPSVTRSTLLSELMAAARMIGVEPCRQ
ncbi:MAG: DEAD/DEAH box helicase [Pirellulales bacterium]|nr:DEAD/DEAH box helicase [Pirellulales bacterium]